MAAKVEVPKETLLREIERRRTFAIISHPDAGKTTLTEKLLLYGGAVHIAGEVKSRRASRHATSDWMAIEKERGISVASSVMQFDHKGLRFNLLDTPGHNDFSEDTYRTLAAADCAVMLVDVAKGVEPQTIKLFEVCRLRKIPIVTFINKLDREGKPPLDLLEEIEQVLKIPTSPMTWPVGMGPRFQGVYQHERNQFYKFERAEKIGNKAETISCDLESTELVNLLGEEAAAELRDDIELLSEAGNPFDEDAFLAGDQTPVFFGSAMTNFGVEPFLDRFASLCPEPRARPQLEGENDPKGEKFSGFVFKIQANMDPKHRDRIAFMRICGGRFHRGMNVKHARTGRKMSLDRSLSFLAQSRETVDEAYSGDILGLWDPGVLRIGDTLHEGAKVEFKGIPVFSPEHFVRVVLRDPLKRKQLKKGLEQLSEEGAVQLYMERDTTRVDPLLGAVGWLQVEVVQHRLKAEYNVEVTMQSLAFKEARWVFGDDFDAKKFVRMGSIECVYDIEERPLLLFDNEWTRRRVEGKFPEFEFKAAVQPARRVRGSA
ncbi:MAG: peptide chain release factor 3 [Deltaproteobacteria bacterium]|nr:peptide chain release factor 3 [Deltaproteobacteria bacterium]